MRALRRWAAGPLSACLGVAGCVAPPPNLKPPLQEEYRLPPDNDRRFVDPPKYPHIPEQLRKTEDVAPNGKPLPPSGPGGGPVSGGPRY
jgi:hypothetical protein